LGQTETDLGGKRVGQRHEFGGFVGSITEHVTLITSTSFFKRLVDVDTLGNIGGLFFNGDDDVAL
jgi:hypothetical protein